MTKDEADAKNIESYILSVVEGAKKPAPATPATVATTTAATKTSTLRSILQRARNMQNKG